MLDKLIAIASSEVGVRESKGNNCGPRIREYQYATNLTPAAWPWCAAFICWCIAKWVEDKEVEKWLALKSRTPFQWRPKTAAAYGFKTWALDRPNTTDIFDETKKAQPGDIVTFDFSHVGLVVEDCGDTIKTIEGNTNGKGERDSESGDGVWKKVRAKSLIKDIIRIHPSTK
jgi:hypothetical protein